MVWLQQHFRQLEYTTTKPAGTDTYDGMATRNFYRANIPVAVLFLQDDT